MLLPPVAGCAAAEASPPPYYSHRWLGHPSTPVTHTPVILRRRQPHTAVEPVNPRTPLCMGIHCRVIPFLGLAVVHCPGALGAAWLTWSTTDMHLKWTVRGEADSWVHDRTQGDASLLRAK